MAKKWYVIQTYSGYRKARKGAPPRAHQGSTGFKNKFGEVLIPTETVQETRPNGKQRTREQTSLPGYIFVEMDMNEEAWHLVKDTSKVMGFIGNQGWQEVRSRSRGADRVAAAGNHEGAARRAAEANFVAGDEVRVIDGPFSNFTGQVEEVKPEKQKVRVKVSIFGRSTPVELDFAQVEKRA